MSQPQWLWSNSLEQWYYLSTAEDGRSIYVLGNGTILPVSDQRDPRNIPGLESTQASDGSFNQSFPRSSSYTTTPSIDRLTVQAGRMNITGTSVDNGQGSTSAPPERRDNNGVAARIHIGPQGQTILLGTSGDQEILDPSYRKRSQPRQFFKIGKVFMTLWTEPSGSTDKNTVVTRVRFGEGVYTQIRRFVVIRAGQHYCIAAPILTYGGRGLSKRDVTASEHALIYTGSQPPPLTSSDAGIIPISIRVDPSEPGERLDPLSRVNLGKTYTIEHNLKVRSFGMVRDTGALMQAVTQATMGTVPMQMREAPIGTNVRIVPVARPNTEEPQPRSVYQQQVASRQSSTGTGQSQAAQRARDIQQARAQQDEEESESSEESSDEEEEQQDPRARLPQYQQYQRR